jgi:hypothetical protein
VRHKPPYGTDVFGLPTIQAARTLIRRYIRYQGELKKAASGEQVLVSAAKSKKMLVHLAAVLGDMNVKFSPTVLKAIRTRPPSGPLEWGQVRAGILKTLRIGNEWMNYSQIADALLVDHGLRLHQDSKRYRHFLQKVREAVHVLANRGHVEQELFTGLRDGRSRQRWRLAGRDRRR